MAVLCSEIWLLIGVVLVLQLPAKPTAIQCSYMFVQRIVRTTCTAAKVYPQVGCTWQVKYGTRELDVYNQTSSNDVVSSEEYYRATCNAAFYISNAGTYVVTVAMKPNLGNGTVKEISVSVVPPQQPPRLYLAGQRLQSLWVEVVENQTLTITCRVPGGDPDVYRTIIKCNNIQQPFESDGSSVTMDVRINRIFNGQKCTCSALHAASYTQTSSVEIRVTYPATVTSFRISSKPSNTTIKRGDEITFACTASGNPTSHLIVQRQHGPMLTNSSTGYTTYKKTATCSDMGSYVCLASNMVQGQPHEDRKVSNLKVTCDITVTSRDEQTNAFIDSFSTELYLLIVHDSLAYTRIGYTLHYNLLLLTSVGNFLLCPLPHKPNRLLLPILNPPGAPELCSGMSSPRFPAAVGALSVSIKICVRAYPAPTSISLYKGNTTDHRADKFQAYFNFTNEEDGLGEITVMKSPFAQGDLGDYLLYSEYRSVELHSNLTFSLFAQGPPSCPTSFTVVQAGPDSLRLSWTRGFNGGLKQTFTILRVDSPNGTASPGFTELGSVKDQDHSNVVYVVTGLSESTTYTFALDVANKEGSGNCSHLRVKGSTSASAAFIGGRVVTLVVVPVIIIILLLVILVVAVVVVRRRRQHEAKKSEATCTRKEHQYVNSPMIAVGKIDESGSRHVVEELPEVQAPENPHYEEISHFRSDMPDKPVDYENQILLNARAEEAEYANTVSGV